MEVQLKNTTGKLCVIGDPVGHSKSPLIQNTMLQALGLDYIYLCQHVPRGKTAEWLRCASFCGYAGFNATMPHKEALVSLMDHLDEDAAMYGAVNTVAIREGSYYGYNTDGRGFLASLHQAEIETEGKRVLLLGAGGAALSLPVGFMPIRAVVVMAVGTWRWAKSTNRGLVAIGCPSKARE